MAQEQEQTPLAFGLSPVRAWLAAAAAAVVALVGGALVFPRAIWDGFLWHYFWGPVYADANNAACAVRPPGGAPELLASQRACTAAEAGRIVAYPGYTVVSEIGYAVTLVFILIGVFFLLRHLGVGRNRGLFFALVPFVFFGGALRVVEDANDASLRADGVEQVISYPWHTLIISPVIYFTVFAVTLGALVVAVWLARRGVVDTYEPVLAGAGSVALVAALAAIVVIVAGDLAVTTAAGFYPQMTVVTLGLALVISWAVYRGLDAVAPGTNEGTRRMGFVVLFAHSVDGVANVVASDWWDVLGLPFGYVPKHPANAFIIDVTSRALPPGLVAAIGSSWPFLVVKVVAAVLVVYLFEETIFEESPRYAVLLLVAIVAVGLGPGTRDMLRATFGI